jgi:hypothetical protein
VDIQSVPWPKIRPAGNSSSVAASPIDRRWLRGWRTWSWCWVRPPGGSRGRRTRLSKRTIPAQTLSRSATRTHRVPTPPPLYAKAGRNNLNEEITPLLPTGTAIPYKNIGHAARLRRCEVPPINESNELTQRAL